MDGLTIDGVPVVWGDHRLDGDTATRTATVGAVRLIWFRDLDGPEYVFVENSSADRVAMVDGPWRRNDSGWRLPPQPFAPGELLLYRPRPQRST